MKKKKKWVGQRFSRGDFNWEGGGTLPQNSYNPFQDLWEDTCKEESKENEVAGFEVFSQ